MIILTLLLSLSTLNAHAAIDCIPVDALHARITKKINAKKYEIEVSGEPGVLYTETEFDKPGRI